MLIYAENHEKTHPLFRLEERDLIDVLILIELQKESKLPFQLRIGLRDATKKMHWSNAILFRPI